MVNFGLFLAGRFAGPSLVVHLVKVYCLPDFCCIYIFFKMKENLTIRILMILMLQSLDGIRKAIRVSCNFFIHKTWNDHLAIKHSVNYIFIYLL